MELKPDHVYIITGNVGTENERRIKAASESTVEVCTIQESRNPTPEQLEAQKFILRRYLNPGPPVLEYYYLESVAYPRHWIYTNNHMTVELKSSSYMLLAIDHIEKNIYSVAEFDPERQMSLNFLTMEDPTRNKDLFLRILEGGTGGGKPPKQKFIFSQLDDRK